MEQVYKKYLPSESALGLEAHHRAEEVGPVVGGLATAESVGVDFGLSPEALLELELASRGYNITEAARKRWVSPETTNYHRDNILSAMGVARMSEAVREGWRVGLLLPMLTSEQKARIEPLTPIQFRVLKQASMGLTQPEIAKMYMVGVNTIKFHNKRIYRKLGAKNIAHAVRIGCELGLFEENAKEEE